MNVGDTIRRFRESQGMSQAELARKVCVTQSMICQIERGTKLPSLPVGSAIAKALGCGVADLMETLPGEE